MTTECDQIKFGDGTYRFFLPLKQIVELERSCGVTDRDGRLHPKSIYRLHEEFGLGLALEGEDPVYLGEGDARPAEIRETLRLALIGGGSGLVGGEEIKVGPLKAQQLCDDYFYPARPIVEGQYIAWAVLNAAIRGVGIKKKAPKPPQGRSSKKASAGGPS